MPAILLRTIILYIFVIIAMKIMGKRQIGQMELSELVTVTMLSEIASYAILDTDIPIFYSIIPLFVLICLEVTISFLCVKSRFISKLFDGKPSYIIYKGKLDKKELASVRLSLTEIISELRYSGINSISEIYYLILEPSGKLSVIPKISRQPLTPQDAKIAVTESGIDHALIIDGETVPQGFRASGKSRDWLDKKLRTSGIFSYSEVFYCAVNDNDKLTLIKNDEKPE